MGQTVQSGPGHCMWGVGKKVQFWLRRNVGARRGASLRSSDDKWYSAEKKRWASWWYMSEYPTAEVSLSQETACWFLETRNEEEEQEKKDGFLSWCCWIDQVLVWVYFSSRVSFYISNHKINWNELHAAPSCLQNWIPFFISVWDRWRNVPIWICVWLSVSMRTKLVGPETSATLDNISLARILTTLTFSTHSTLL